MTRARSLAPRRRALCVVVAASVCIVPSAASAQERLRFELFPDEALYGTTVHHYTDHESPRLMGTVGGSASIWRGASGPQLMTPFVGLGLGAWSSPTTYLQLRTDSALPVREDRAPSSWRDGEGSHRMSGQLGVGDLSSGSTGADIGVDASLFHGGATTTQFLRRDLDARPFWDGTVRATVWPRYMQGSDEAVTTPLSYQVRRVEFDGANGFAGGFTSTRFASGFGIRDFDTKQTHGWVEILGVAWEKTAFDAAPGLPRPRLGGVERFDLKLAHADAMYGEAASDMRLGASAYVGGSWLWDSTTRNEVSAFAFALAVSLRHVPKRDDTHGDELGGGLGISRRAGFMADGSALTQGWRVEAFSDVMLFKRRAGGAFRMGAEQVTSPIGGGDPGFRSIYTSEWFLGLGSALHLGFFHVSTDRCPAVVSPIGEWCHQVGVFLRVNAETAPPAPPPPPPPPPPRPVVHDDWEG